MTLTISPLWCGLFGGFVAAHLFWIAVVLAVTAVNKLKARKGGQQR